MDSLESINSKTVKAFDLAAQRYHDLFHNEMNEKEYDRRLLDSFAAQCGDEALICDAGCGPSGHIGRYLYDKGMRVIGLDISPKCVELARRYNPGMRFELGDINNMPFENGIFDGIIAYYSIISTPKKYVDGIFDEFNRVLKPGGRLLVAVKAGETEGFINDILGIQVEIYFAMFSEDEIAGYYENAGFSLEFLERRDPYDFEIQDERTYAIGRKESQ
jgi:SAM-dependent methyltransferase